MRRCPVNPVGRARTLALVAAAALPLSCGGGVNAGEEGGVAFILFTIMLLVMIGVLAVVLGRED